MNRIILIGNGFDLAHGLPTRYSDFINWYWDDWGKRLLHSNNRVEQDMFCTFTLTGKVPERSWGMALNYYFQNEQRPGESFSDREAIEFAKHNKSSCTFAEKSGFFKEICKQVEDKGWVDIENVYYSYLCSGIFEPQMINKELDYIRERLVEYLLNIQKNITESLIKENIKNKLMEPFKMDDFAVSAKSNTYEILSDSYKIKKGEVYPNRILLLNFNYTSMADLYSEKDNRFVINHIHGDLSDLESVIFGYGDELDTNYKMLLDKNNNEYLRHIKQYRYLDTPKYRQVLEFTEAAPYQIYIMGHSCGNSDRVLLNTLFEHKNCVSIKPYYYVKSDGSNNYLELVQNISRNFTDMKLMRDRVVNKTFCEVL